MTLPDVLSQDDVVAGIAAFQAGDVVHDFKESRKFDLLHEDGRFPPKAITALAAKHNSGVLPVPRDFSGGAGSKCFRILRAAGFRVVPKPGLIPFEVGHKYKRNDVRDYIGTADDTTKGDWGTGYHFHNDEVAGILGWWFVFASVGDAGRTGHDYPNKWLDDSHLEWSGKSHTKLGQSQIESLLSGLYPTLLFSRPNDRDPFTYHGLANVETGSIKDQTPVMAVWGVGTAPEEVSNLDDNEADANPQTKSYSSDGKDERDHVIREIRARRGQEAFRKSLLKEFGKRCAISGCDVMGVLEAAHIRPYRGPNDNHVQNGLLLRADLHTLFDLNLLGIDPTTRKVCIHQSIRRPPYDGMHGRDLPTNVPISHEALMYRWQEFLSSDH